jgi:putative nucleotidyltransferase with HDIG domain
MSYSSTEHIIERTSDYVLKMLTKQLSPEMTYHNAEHTMEVVEAAGELASKAELDGKNSQLLIMAAWLHDTGYTRTYENHEEASVQIADEFLKKEDFPKDDRQKVLALIRSTTSGADKHDRLARLLHDADLSHMGRKRFFRKGEMLRAELENLKDETYSESEWQQTQYEFLTQNDFISIEGKDLYGSRRARNIIQQRENIEKAHKLATRKKSGKEFGRGIDTLYRTNYRNHINFSSIADGKANMMISINTILISVIVTLSGASLSLEGFMIERFRYTIPILVLLLGSLCSVLFAVLSARPKVTTKNVDLKQVREDNISLLYFGNFLGIPKNEFIEYLKELKMDHERLYDSMSIDLYNLGIVLKEKYRLLSISYNIFMIGLSISVLAFIVIFVVTNATH